MTTEIVVTTENQEWFRNLIDDCKSIITEFEFIAKWELVQGWHQVGMRILEDEANITKGGYTIDGMSQRVATSLNRSQRTIEQSIQFARKCPDLNLLPYGKNVTWRKICLEYLPEKPELKQLAPMTGEVYRLYCADFRVKCQELEPNSIDAIITDPPYDQESVNLYSGLGEVSARLLKDGGSLLVMSGNMYLPDLLNRLCEHLNYQWQIAFLMGTGTSRVWPRKVCQMWKPILWFVKGKYTGDWVTDLFHSVKPEKALHEWQQPESISTWLIERFSQPSGVIFDPMMGTGTNGIEAIKLNRYFIGIDQSEDNLNIARSRFNDKMG